MSLQYSEIRALLRDKRLSGLSGNGACEKEIVCAERELDLLFPPSYRSFLKEFGWGYFGSLELIAGLGADIPQEW
jgi:hypothetical protein